MKYKILIACLFLFSIADFATITQKKEIFKVSSFLKGELKGVQILKKGGITPGKTYELIENDYINKNLSDIIYINNNKFFYSTSVPNTIYYYEKINNKFIKKSLFKLDDSVISVSKLFYDYEINELIYGTIPDGKIYYYPSKILCKLPVTYIYKILKFKDFYLVATGPGGKIFKVDSNGEYELFCKLKLKNINDILIYDDSLLVSSDDNSCLYDISLSTKKIRIYENFEGFRIKKMLKNNGKIYLALNKNSRSVKKTEKFENENYEEFEKMTSAIVQEFDGKIERKNMVSSKKKNVTSNHSNGSRIVILSNNDKKVPVELKSNLIEDFGVDNSENIFILTNKKNKIYKFYDKNYSIIHYSKTKLIEKIGFDKNFDLKFFGTDEPAKLYEFKDTDLQNISYISEVYDLGYKSEYGIADLDSFGKLLVEYRDGTTLENKEYWNDWSSDITKLSARYFQFKIKFLEKNAVMKKIIVPYKQINLSPRIKSIKITKMPKQTLSSKNNNKNSKFPKSFSPKKNNREIKEFLSYKISWKTEDLNEDELIYHIYYSYENSDWIEIKFKNFYEDDEYTWSTKYFPDGVYKFKIVVSDEKTNFKSGKFDEIISEKIMVDNSAPEISSEQKNNKFILNVTDKYSLIKSIEYKYNDENWIKLEPVDGIFDERMEKAELDVSNLKGLITFKVYDIEDNLNLKSIVLK